MRLTSSQLYIMVLTGAIFLFVQCSQSQAYQSPGDYDFSKPLTYPLDDKLKEISGISFQPGDDQVIYAIEDEHARLFRLSIEGRIQSAADFGKKGDYEDISITSSASYVLRSDGALLTGQVAEGDEAVESTTYDKLLPSGEYEGLTAESDNTLLALCKDCKGKKDKASVTAYKISVNDGKPGSATMIKFDLSSLDASLFDRKISPSGIARNPQTGQWFILSSVNKLLVVLEPNMDKPKAFTLDPVIFPQPEGICFDSKGNLYISNESVTGPATLLKFGRKGGEKQ